MRVLLNSGNPVTKRAPGEQQPAPTGAVVRLIHSFLEIRGLLGCLVLTCSVCAPIYAQVDQKCVQRCEMSNCTAGDTPKERLQQCRTACVKNCTNLSPPATTSAATTASGQEVGYMKVTTAYGTIVGQSKEVAHQAWIELHSVQYAVTKPAAGIANQPSPASIGAGRNESPTKSPAGSVADSGGTLMASKLMDQSSPALQRACATGEHLKEVVIDVYRGGKPAQRLVLSDVRISSFQPPQGNSGVEKMTLNFSKIKE